MYKLLLSILLSCCLNSGALTSTPPTSQIPVDIPIRPGEDMGNTPRGSTQTPVLCFSISNAIMLQFLSDVGIVDVTIRKESEGVVFEDTVNSGSGVSILDFSGSSGQYTITISISTGLFYYGEFVL